MGRSLPVPVIDEARRYQAARHRVERRRNIVVRVDMANTFDQWPFYRLDCCLSLRPIGSVFRSPHEHISWAEASAAILRTSSFRCFDVTTVEFCPYCRLLGNYLVLTGTHDDGPCRAAGPREAAGKGRGGVGVRAKNLRG